MANAAVWRKMALIRQPAGCGEKREYEAGTWLMVVGDVAFARDPTEWRSFSVLVGARDAGPFPYSLEPLAPFEFRGGPF